MILQLHAEELIKPWLNKHYFLLSKKIHIHIYIHIHIHIHIYIHTYNLNGIGGLGFEFRVFIAGWRHALRSEWPCIIIIII